MKKAARTFPGLFASFKKYAYEYGLPIPKVCVSQQEQGINSSCVLFPVH